MKTKIWLSPPHMSGAEMKYIQEAFNANWIAPVGPNIDCFEENLCRYISCRKAVALASGTASLHLALITLGIKTDDIVLCQSLTFAASANPIVYQGATPVFIDSEEITWNICPNALEDAIKFCLKKGKKPKAVIGVHLYGMPLQIKDILILCDRYDIPFIEDAAEALGSRYQDQPLGSFGKMGILSFNGNKIITTSAGGALLSSNELLSTRALFLATQAKNNTPHYEHSEIGYNYRMSNVCAGIGLGQLEVIDERVRQRRYNFNFYRDALSNLPGISFQNEPEDCFSNRWLTAILIDPAKSAGITRETVRLHLQNENIESRPVWKPMHLQPIFSGSCYFGGTTSEKLFVNGLCLPSGSNLTASELDRVVNCIKKSFHKREP